MGNSSRCGVWVVMTLSHPRKPLLAVLGFLLSTFVVTAAPMKFDIPAQPAAPALQAFGQQASVQVVFNADDLKDVSANEVKGAFEPGAALTQLLRDTGFISRQRDGRLYVILKEKGANAIVRGALSEPGGRPLAGVLVVLRGTGLSATTEATGEFIFGGVEPGNYVIVATASGYQPLHLTDVMVHANSDVALSRQTMRKATAADALTKLEPFVVKAEAVTKLGEFEVTSAKTTRFLDGNVDLPRTINDARPYYVFEAATIEQSGAANIEELLKQRLTMNAAALSNSQVALQGTAGNTSSFNLRGVGAGSTLVLVNGRRMAGVTISTGSAAQSTPGQPDLNGIPLSAVERIEVMPSSAAGIYGGAALGGVINVILKTNYRGGEIRATYDNTVESDSPRRTISLAYGTSLEGGKTTLTLNGQWSDSQPLLLQDRLGLFRRGMDIVLRNDPSVFSSQIFNPFLGATPNIISSGGSTPLVLKSAWGGSALGSTSTFVPAGTSSTTSATTLGSTLLANAGKQNLDLPDSTQTPTGLRRQFGVTVKTKSFQAGLRRRMAANLDFFADFSLNENHSVGVYNPINNAFSVAATVPTNPFTTAVSVRAPINADYPMRTASDTRSFSTGLVAKLPHDWNAMLDYSWSENRYSYNYTSYDVSGLSAAITAGTINPFVDTLANPLALEPFLQPIAYSGASTQEEVGLRGSGPLPSYRWVQPTLTTGISRRKSGTPQRVYTTVYPITTTSNSIVTYYPLYQWVDSAYGELLVPLVPKDRIPFVRNLELQLSGREEWYRADTGTTGYSEFPNRPTLNGYLGTTLNGQPFRAKEKYSADGYSIGFKYEPVPDVTIRASRATAFVPVSPSQLILNPNATITAGTSYSTWAPGNADLKPQNSVSTNVGIIWEPRNNLFDGLRLNAEYYRIRQFDAISSVSADTIIAFEELFPGRVTRNAAGVVTLVDVSAVNLFKRETEGWDLSADYRRRTPWGTFSVSAVESIMLHLKTQYSLTAPDYDAVDFPSEQGGVKYKSNFRAVWTRKNWTLGWTTNYYASYKQNGAAGGPIAAQRIAQGRTPFTTYTVRQGGDTIPSQIYHDAFVSYAFGRSDTEGKSRPQKIVGHILDDVTLQLGVRNVFNRLPPFDAFYETNYYLSPYGDSRLRTYWLNVIKKF